MSHLRAEIAETLDEAEWEWLIPHVQRDVVVVVAENLDLVDVGVALATDNVSSIQHWISEQLIGKPTFAQLQVWNNDRTKRFKAAIVQPYVLIQEFSL